jgi:hypothetical protein
VNLVLDSSLFHIQYFEAGENYTQTGNQGLEMEYTQRLVDMLINTFVPGENGFPDPTAVDFLLIMQRGDGVCIVSKYRR